MKARGLYGQTEGNESRQGTAVMGERIADNTSVEGHEQAVLTAMFNDRSRWAQIDPYCVALKAKGWGKARIESLISRATFQMPRNLY